MRFAACCILLLLLLIANGIAAEAPRVLVVHSFGNAAPPFTTHSIAFETELTEKFGERVDLDQVSLDVARYASLDMEEALVDFMRKRQSKWQPDLVVPVGSPAGVFVAQYRDRIFAKGTPIIYTGMDRRRLPEAALRENAAFVGENFDFTAMMDDVLQLAPDTTNVAVVIGASQLEQYWAAAIAREWAPFTNRVQFTWLNDVSFDQMLECVSRLPPRSFIFLVLLMRDATGVAHDADEALKRIRAVANAPVNSIFQHQLGLGIVGGRLYQAEQEGIESARIAVRVLRGEPITNFPPMIVPPLGPRYDARELRRWNISEDRLPEGSTVLFREATAWQRYKWRIMGVAFLCVVQTAMISLLIVSLARRRKAELSLRENEKRMALAADAARLGMWIWDVPANRYWFSDRCRRLFDYPDDVQLTVEHVRARVHPEDRPRRDANIAQVLATGGTYSHEYRIELPSREIRWMAGSGRVELDASGAPARVLGIAIDITERKAAENAAREVSGKLITAQEDERKRIARDLHDDLNQRLAMLSVETDLLGRSTHDPSSQTRIKEMSARIRELSSDVHKLSYQLHPAKLDHLGLVLAARSLCNELSEQSGIRVQFSHIGTFTGLDREMAICLYRIIQEALQNTIKHSQATEARVHIENGPEGLTLAVSDNGKGFDMQSPSQNHGLGLVGIRERVRLIHGDVVVESQPGSGTMIKVSVSPVSPDPDFASPRKLGVSPRESGSSSE